jgi:hypothetical protein
MPGKSTTHCILFNSPAAKTTDRFGEDFSFVNAVTLRIGALCSPRLVVFKLKSIAVWDMAPCSPLSFNPCFRVTYRLRNVG